MDIKLMPEKYKKGGIGSGAELPQKGFWQSLIRGNLLFSLSLVILIGTGLVCLGLWGYKISLDNDKDELIQRSEELENQRNLDLENEFIALKEKIEIFKNILDGKVYSSNILTLLEEITLPQVKYSSFSTDLSVMSIELDTEAGSYGSLIEQVVVFEGDERIKETFFSEVNLDKEGWVGTSFKLDLDPAILYSE